MLFLKQNDRRHLSPAHADREKKPGLVDRTFNSIHKASQANGSEMETYSDAIGSRGARRIDIGGAVLASNIIILVR